MRSTAVIAPLFLFFYGVLRWVDALDGHRGGSLAWNLGHVLFFLAIVLFAVLAVGLLRAVPVRLLGDAAVVATLAGAGCFLWVITGDLFRGFGDRYPLPGALNAVGPLLFVLGLVVLLGMHVAGGRLPVWSPVLFFAGYLAISIDLDLLPGAALLVLAAMVPVARIPVARPTTAARETSH